MSLSVPNVPPLFANAYNYALVTRMRDNRLFQIGVALPCLLDEALFLAEAGMQDSVPDHLLGLKSVFALNKGVLWYGHVMVNLNNLVCGSVDVVQNIAQRDSFLERIGAVEGASSNPFWALSGRDIFGNPIQMPFFGPIEERVFIDDGACSETHDLLFFRGNVFKPSEFQQAIFTQIPWREFMRLKYPDNEDSE